MSEKRSGTDRRTGKDRRSEETSSYNGPERRRLNQRRRDRDRRYQKISLQLDAAIIWISAFCISTLFLFSAGYLFYTLIIH